MRVISLNVNGIRSAAQKGVLDWLASSEADFICMQEIRAQPSDLPDTFKTINAIKPMHSALHSAEKKGYSGVALYSWLPPTRLNSGLGNPEFDQEGRLLRADFDGLSAGPEKLTIVSLYAPSGSASEDRQASKFRFMQAFFPVLRQWMHEHVAEGREFVVCGDWNIAHTERDLKNWKGNLKNSGFLPEERRWFTQVLQELGWVDVYRSLYPDAEAEGYTWWSNRGQARAKNVGWRIDYQIATPGIARTAHHAEVFKNQKFSDHAPIIVDYRI